PDVRDGMKPANRRVLYGMQTMGLQPGRPYRKCAKIVGEVMGNFHPHGDMAIYDTLVRMAQPFNLRALLVDGQGNFGSIDGDNAAAMRYTEARMSRLTHELMADIDKETVNFQLNYDEKEYEPTVMPTRFPNLLVNGSAGIAVGMATNIPPHNLSEVIDALIALIADPQIGVEGLMEHISGPDFPTAGIINGTAGIHAAYRTGRGRVRMRARAEIEVNEDTGREAIAVTEIPYQVNKARLIEKIAELVKEKKLEGITELRDESDKDGMRIYIEIKRGDSADVVLNNLYQQTQMESVFGINMVALVDGRPQLLNLKQILEAFVRHRREVVTRRTIFDLRKARARAHILEGLTVALANIDEMIELIKTSANPQEARDRMLARTWEPGLVGALLAATGSEASRPEDLPKGVGLLEDNRYQLTDIQATQILEMRLHRLTGLEQEKLTDEYKLLLETIRGLIEILEDPDVLLNVIRAELLNVKEEFGDARRSEIRHSEEDLDILDLIAPEDVVVTLSHAGYAKRQPASAYRAQRRGGRGRSAAATKEEDFIDQLWLVNTHDTLLTFTSAGRVFWLSVYQLPDAGSNARGRPIVNWIPLEPGEQVQAVLPVREYDDRNVLFATRHGTVKKTPLSEFSYRLARGKIAINLDEGDALVGVAMTDGTRDVMLFASNGKGVRFAEKEVRSMGRNTTGVRGIRLAKGEEVRSLIVIEGDGDILTASQRGYGKRTPVAEYPRKGRGTQGVIAIRTSERNGRLVGAIQLSDHHEVLLISDGGTLVRTRAAEISQVSRNTQGVTLMRLAADETLQAIERVDALLEDEVVVGPVVDASAAEDGESLSPM
ncbi:MAG: DNA gyrase subunit A, partial [Luteimonas sp.]|nr:DNA gyrase subunit A [Luteimonas sp.]